MSILRAWREARGTTMRKDLEDVMASMRNASQPERRTFLNKIHQTIDSTVESYSSASATERKQFLRAARDEASMRWNSGDGPSALGIAISCLNAESRFVSGDDAAYVRRETESLIQEARIATESCPIGTLAGMFSHTL